MHRIAWIFTVAATVFVITAAPAAHAQTSRTFVSGHGTDSGTCGVTAPCRSFAYAVTQTATGGEITVLDSAGYGPVTIARALTITNPGGVEAGITATAGGDAIAVTAPSPAAVTLRGLTLAGGGSGANGIDVISAQPYNSGTLTVSILGCVIAGFTGDGIKLNPSGSGNGQVPHLLVPIADSFILNNAGNGIEIGTQAGVLIDGGVYRTLFSANNTAMALNGGTVGSYVSVISSDFGINTGAAMTVGAGAVVTLVGSTGLGSNGTEITNNGTLLLYRGNEIGAVVNNGTGYTDGTNGISLVENNALKPLPPQ